MISVTAPRYTGGMTETPRIDESMVPTPEGVTEIDHVPMRKNIGYGVVGLAVFVASITGALGGVGIMHTLFPKPVPFNTASLETALSGLEADQKSLQTMITQLDRKSREKTNTSIPTETMIAIQAQLATLESRFDALAEMDGPEGEVLPVLSARIEALENRPNNTEQTVLEPRMKALEDQVALIEDRLETVRAKSASPIVVALPVFPAQTLRTIIDAANTDNKGWIARKLYKHIDIRRSGEDDVISEIEAMIAKHDLKTAIKLFEQLPEKARLAGADWIEAARSIDQGQPRVRKDVNP